MKMPHISCTIFFLLSLSPSASSGQQLYTHLADTETRWISFENPTGARGKGGMENKGAKGHPSQWINPGEKITLVDLDGAGIINRIWLTIIDRNPEALRSIHIEMYWDHAEKPAVAVPLGDFFGIGLGRKTPFQNSLFSDPEGKSFNCYVPMPFREHAKIVFVNGSKQKQLLFYDVNLIKVKKLPEGTLYFHSYWSNHSTTRLGEDFVILPKVAGKGRFLGTNFSVIADEIYAGTWFGEGEVKIYLDGDTSYPTLVGTGLEDYIGTAWNLGPFTHMYQGCPIADKEKRQFAFYRYHVPDPVYFNSDCRVTIQQMGGGGRDQIRSITEAGGRVKVVSYMTSEKLIKLLDDPSAPDIFDNEFPKDEWTNFYRIDNYSATAYFYLDQPANSLPALTASAERMKGMD